jgi:hypothetical protein
LVVVVVIIIIIIAVQPTSYGYYIYILISATMVWSCKENATKQAAMLNFRMGTTGKSKKVMTRREVDGVRRSMTNHGLTEEYTRDGGTWGNLVLICHGNL